MEENITHPIKQLYHFDSLGLSNYKKTRKTIYTCACYSLLEAKL